MTVRGIPWWRVSGLLAALLAMVGIGVSLGFSGRVYGGETAVLADAAIAQDLAGIAVALGILVLDRLPGTGARSLWLGALGFFAYNYAIYAFSLHFGPLFLVWVAVLGLSSFAALGGLVHVLGPDLPKPPEAARATGWYLMGAAVIFALLWLSEIVPDLIAGRPSTSAAAWLVPTSPVHVLDLAFFLPATFVAGVAVLRRRPYGALLAVPALTWLALTCLPIFATPLVAVGRGHSASFAVYGSIGAVFVASLVFLGIEVRRSLRTATVRALGVTA